MGRCKILFLGYFKKYVSFSLFLRDKTVHVEGLSFRDRNISVGKHNQKAPGLLSHVFSPFLPNIKLVSVKTMTWFALTLSK